MPVVRSQRQVRREALPGVRLTAAETALSQGAGVAEAQARTGQAIAQFGERAAFIGLRVYQDERKKEYDKANSVILMESEKELAKFHNQRMTAALQVKGKDAMTLPESVLADYDKLADQLESRLTNDDQRAAFAKIRTNQAMSMDLTLRRHVAGEMSTYAQNEAKALVGESLNLMTMHALDPKLAQADLESAIKATRQQALAMGAGPKTTEDMVRDVTSAGHLGVIDRLLAKPETLPAAQAYFDEAKEQISGEGIAKVEKALKAGSLRAQSQTIADDIIAKGGTLAERKSAAKLATEGNAELRDEVNQRLEHQQNLDDKAKRDKEDADSLKAFNTVRRSGGNIYSIPAHELDALPPATQSALYGWAERLRQGIPVKTDQKTWYNLKVEAAESPSTFIAKNILDYADKLSEADFQELTSLKAAIISGNKEAAAKLNGDFLTQREVIDTTLKQYGYTVSGQGEDVAVIANMQRLLQDAVTNYVAVNGKKPDTAFIQRAADHILAQQVTVPGWFGDKTVRLADMTVAKIPKAERKQIESDLAAEGVPVTDQNILSTYLRAKMPVPKKPGGGQ